MKEVICTCCPQGCHLQVDEANGYKVTGNGCPNGIAYGKEGFFHYRCDWCRKWLRFSTDPTLVMLCYVWLARCEVQDLDHIIEGVHYKLPPEDVQPLLVGFDEKD